MDPHLWRIENYPDFLAERQRLLARAANAFLDSLLVSSQAEPVEACRLLWRRPVSKSSVF